jgi:hypothetical protein
MLEKHATLKAGEQKSGYMPTAFVGKAESDEDEESEQAKPVAKKASSVSAKKTAPAVDANLDTQLSDLAKKSANHTAFVLAAMKIRGVTRNEALQASVMDDSDEGYYATHQEE